VRLPPEEEWKRAGRGTDGREYPWGDEFDFIYANVAEEIGKGISTTAVCTYLQGKSPAGVWDMSGNVLEWTKSRVVRGGAWFLNHKFARCVYRYDNYRLIGNNGIGFRVCAVSRQE
jgi:formylglycine-generating enzyme required for sulfatase activity